MSCHHSFCAGHIAFFDTSGPYNTTEQPVSSNTYRQHIRASQDDNTLSLTHCSFKVSTPDQTYHFTLKCMRWERL